MVSLTIRSEIGALEWTVFWNITLGTDIRLKILPRKQTLLCMQELLMKLPLFAYLGEYNQDKWDCLLNANIGNEGPPTGRMDADVIIHRL